MTEKSNNIKLSIIVPVFKAENFINRCLDSIQAQTFVDWECILIDDGSPDKSGIICDEYASKDCRFVVIHQQNNGASAARNAGLQVAHGEWISFIDSDDWIDSNMYQEVLSSFDEDNFDIVLFGVWDEYKTGQKTFCPKLPKGKKQILKSFAKYPNYLNYPVNKIYRHSMLKKYNVMFPLGIKICEDLFFNITAFFFAKSVYQFKKSFYHYNHCNELSAMNNYNIKYFYDKCWVAENISSFFQKQAIYKDYHILVQFYKIYAKLVLILYPNLRNSSLWKKTFRDANKYILFTPLRLDYKILSILCSMGLFKTAYFLQDLKKRSK